MTLRFVHWTPGSGTAALAAAREGLQYMAVVSPAAPDLHRTLLRDAVAVQICLELSVGTRDGFRAPRFLSRQQSLGGETPPPTADAMVPAQPETTQVAGTTQVPETTEVAQASSESSSDSE